MLRMIFVGISAFGGVLGSLTDVLPPGKVRLYVTLASAFLGGLAVNAEPLLSTKQKKGALK